MYGVGLETVMGLRNVSLKEDLDDITREHTLSPALHREPCWLQDRSTWFFVVVMVVGGAVEKFFFDIH